MADLPPPEEIKELLEAGIPASQIGEFIRRGSFDAALMQARQKSGKLGPKQGWARPQSPSLRSLIPAAVATVAAPFAAPFASNAGFINLFKNAIPGRAEKARRPFPRLGQGALESRPFPRLGRGALEAAPRSIEKNSRRYGRKERGELIRPADPEVYPEESPYGQYPEFQPPQLSLKDFTSQGQGIASQIYGPQFQALDQASQGAQQQYQRSDKVLAGLYRNLVDSIAQRQATTDRQYGQAVAAEQAGGQKLVGQIGNTYKASQNQQADLMKRLGLQEAASDTLGRGASDQAYQQSEALQSSQAQRNALGTMRQGQADYATNLQNASTTQGTVSRENLLNDLSQVLRTYDQQRLGVTSDQSNAAMEIANRLSQQDLDLQRMQYGAYGDSYDAQVRQYESGRDQYNQGRNYLSDIAEREQQQANLDRNYELDVNKYETDLATQSAELQLRQAQQGKQELPDIGDYDPVSRIIEQTNRQYGPGTGPQYYDFVDQYMRSLSGKGVSFAERYALNPALFMMEVSDAAQQKGLNPRVAQAVANGYFQMLRRTAGS